MAKFKAVMAQAHQIKEHPGGRRMIVSLGLRPHPSLEAWEGQVIGSNGQVREFSDFGDAIQKQLCRMAYIGEFSD